MKRAEATAQVFMTAFEPLPRSGRGMILQRLFADPALKEDFIDVAAWYGHRTERVVPYQRARARLKKAGRPSSLRRVGSWSDNQLLHRVDRATIRLAEPHGHLRRRN